MTVKNLYVDNTLIKVDNPNFYTDTLTYTDLDSTLINGASVSKGSANIYKLLINIGYSSSSGSLKFINNLNFVGKSLSTGKLNIYNILLFSGKSLSVGSAKVTQGQPIKFSGKSLSVGNSELIHIFYIDGKSASSGDVKLISLLSLDGSSLSSGNIDSLVLIDCQVPTTKLNLTVALSKLSQVTGNQLYKDKGTEIINQLLDKMSILGDKYSSAIPFVILLLKDGTVLNERYGSYVSDVNPLAWYLYGHTDKEIEAVKFIIESQDKYKELFINDGLFIPYCVRNLPENTGIGDVNEWVMDGILGNEKDFIHQYKTISNLAEYYYYKNQRSNYKDIYLDDIIHKFYDLILSKGDVPTAFVNQEIDCSSTDVYVNNSDVLVTTTYYEGLNWDKKDLYQYAYLAKACLMTYLMERGQKCLDLAEMMIERILSYKQPDGSFKLGNVTYLKEQGLIMEVLSLYSSTITKSYFTIVNDAMRMMNLDPINEENKDTHYQREVLPICEDGVNEIFGVGDYIEILNFNNVPDLIEPRSYHVLKYYIAWQLGLTREHELTDWFQDKFREAYSRMTYRKDVDLTEVNQMPSNIDWGYGYG